MTVVWKEATKGRDGCQIYTPKIYKLSAKRYQQNLVLLSAQFFRESINFDETDGLMASNICFLKKYDETPVRCQFFNIYLWFEVNGFAIRIRSKADMLKWNNSRVNWFNSNLSISRFSLEHQNEGERIFRWHL